MTGAPFDPEVVSGEPFAAEAYLATGDSLLEWADSRRDVVLEFSDMAVRLLEPDGLRWLDVPAGVDRLAFAKDGEPLLWLRVDPPTAAGDGVELAMAPDRSIMRLTAT